MATSTFQRTKPNSTAVLLGVAIGALLLAQMVLWGTFYLLIPAAIGFAAIAFNQTFRSWRMGLAFFLGWMLVEDLARKFLGNNMAIFFAKDVLAAACCLSFFSNRDRERSLKGGLPFFLPFILFSVWALLEMFNPNSPSLWYGVLGLKLYFGYVPLFFLGYALFRTETDLRRFLLANIGIALLIAGLGIAQGISGKTILAPTELPEDIRELGTLMREAPTTHEIFTRPTSVFVSDGRFAFFMILAWLLGFAATTYFYVRQLPGRQWLLPIMGTFLVAIVLTGSRTSLIYTLMGTSFIAPMFLREIQWGDSRSRRIAGAVVSTSILGIVAIISLSYAYPEALNSRVAFYQQTLSLSSPTSQVSWRVVGYPIQEFMKAFNDRNWFLGNGTGTASLGGQYVTRILGAAPTGVGVESGYGNLLLELGAPGLILWFVWTSTLLCSGWGVVRRLRGSPLFPISLVILWFAFVVLIAGLMGGLGYENYIMNAYLCLLLGIFFSLPSLPLDQPAPPNTMRTVGSR